MGRLYTVLAILEEAPFSMQRDSESTGHFLEISSPSHSYPTPIKTLPAHALGDVCSRRSEWLFLCLETCLELLVQPKAGLAWPRSNPMKVPSPFLLAMVLPWLPWPLLCSGGAGPTGQQEGNWFGGAIP